MTENTNGMPESQFSNLFGDAEGEKVQLVSVPGTSKVAALPEGYTMMPDVPGYDKLAAILAEAYKQAAFGKGKERHSKGSVGFQPWDQQPIITISRQVGPGGPAYQVKKKAGESVTLAGNGNFEGAKAEALGAIVYAAALYLIYVEQQVQATPNT